MITIRRFAEYLAILSFLLFVGSGAYFGSLLVLAAAMAAGVFPLLYYAAHYDLKLGVPLLLFILGVFLSYPLVLMNNGFTSGYMHGGMVVASAGVAFFFGTTRRTGVLAPTLALVLGMFLFSVLVLGLPARSVFLGSENRVSTLFLALAVLLAAIRRSRWDLPMSAVVFLGCVLAGGTTGVVGSAVLLVLVVTRELLRSRRRAWFWKTAVVVGGVVIVVLSARLITAEATRQLALERLFGGDVRYDIIRTYVDQNFRGTSLLAGVPFDYQFQIVNAAGEISTVANLHNSYLSAHSKTGIFVLLLFGAIATRLLTLLRRDWYMAGLFMILLLRAFGDTVFILDGRYNFSFLFFLLPLRLILPERALAPATPESASFTNTAPAHA